jgi:hypothetical protein
MVRDMPSRFVPEDFEPPEPPAHDDFVLEPLGPEHNERDHAAWTSSVDHIRRTPEFPMEDGWPVPMSLEDNLRDLELHAADFAARRGFTYTVLSPPDRDVIGCVYLCPSRKQGRDASVRAWVRASHAHLDGALRRTISEWLASEWPFERIDDDARDHA